MPLWIFRFNWIVYIWERIRGNFMSVRYVSARHYECGFVWKAL